LSDDDTDRFPLMVREAARMAPVNPEPSCADMENSKTMPMTRASTVAQACPSIVGAGMQS
jgi:hypothetical protein